MSDVNLRVQLEHYEKPFKGDDSANRGNDGIRVRAWRRCVIQEARRRGFITADPGGAL